MLGKVVGCLHTKGFKSCCIASAYAPNFIYRIKFQGFDTLLVRINHAAMAVALVFLGEMAGHLRKGLVGSQSDTDRHSHVSLDFLMQLLAPSFQVYLLHAVKIDEALVDAIAKVCRILLLDDFNHTTRQFSIQLIVG